MDQLENEISKIKMNINDTDKRITINNDNINYSNMNKEIQTIPQKHQPLNVIMPNPTTDISNIKDKNKLPEQNMNLNCKFLSSKECHPSYPKFVGASINLGENASMSCDGIDEQKQAKVVCTISKGSINNIYVIDGGKGYMKKPKINIVGGGGRNVIIDCEISKSKLTKVNIIKGGEGYHETPTLQVDPPSLSNACYLCCK